MGKRLERFREVRIVDEKNGFGLDTDFNTSKITSEFNTPFIRVVRGVLQGDYLSPLLFNMCFNTFIQHIKDGRFLQFGFFEKLVPVHWFQFADDAAVISGQESENHILLNCFSIWYQLSDMIIRVDRQMQYIWSEEMPH